jgi:hypothetical protein
MSFLPIPISVLELIPDEYLFLVDQLEKVKEYFNTSIQRMSKFNEKKLNISYHNLEARGDIETEIIDKDKKYLSALKFRLALDLKKFNSQKKLIDIGHLNAELYILRKIHNFDQLFEDFFTNISQISSEYFKYRELNVKKSSETKSLSLKKKYTKLPHQEICKVLSTFDIDSLNLPWRFLIYNSKLRYKFIESIKHICDEFILIDFIFTKKRKINLFLNLDLYREKKEFLMDLYTKLCEKSEPKNIYEEYQIQELGFSGDKFMNDLIGLVDKYNIHNWSSLEQYFAIYPNYSIIKTMEGLELTFPIAPQFCMYLDKTILQITFLVKLNNDDTVNMYILNYKKEDIISLSNYTNFEKRKDELNKSLFKKCIMVGEVEQFLLDNPNSLYSESDVWNEYIIFMYYLSDTLTEISSEKFKVLIIKMIYKKMIMNIKAGFTPKSTTSTTSKLVNGKCSKKPRILYQDLRDFCGKYIKNYIRSELTINSK